MRKYILIAALLVFTILFTNFYLLGKEVEVKQTSLTEYKLLNGSSFFDLEKEVNRYIKYGYQPMGGVTTSGNMYVQAIVK